MKSIGYLALAPFIVAYILISLPFVTLAVFAALAAAMCNDDDAVKSLDKFIRKVWWFDSKKK